MKEGVGVRDLNSCIHLTSDATRKLRRREGRLRVAVSRFRNVAAKLGDICEIFLFALSSFISDCISSKPDSKR